MRLGVLLRSELLKTRKRLSFKVAYGFICFVMLMGFGSELLEARNDPERSFALPDAWREILGEPMMFALFIGCVALILLIASEFSWRTARQNVIDGLSKEQWFVGKQLLLPIMAVLFVGTSVLIGGGLAWLGTDQAGATDPMMTGAQWAAIGGWTLAFLGMGSLAFTFAFAIRSTGAAIGVWFLYLFAEGALLPGLLARLGEWIRPALEYLPFNVFQALTEYLQYDAAAYAAVVERAAANDRPPPSLPDTGDMVLAAVLWIALLLTLSFVWFRKRDL